MLTTRRLKLLATQWRRGLLGKDGSSRGMCFAVSASFGGWLSAAYGIDTEVVTVHFAEINHCWLRLPDGRIIDATADQFGLEPVYVGPLPLIYESRKARLVQA
jgi:hypothetical protein